MVTSAKQAFESGYEQVIKLLYDEELATTAAEKSRLRKERVRLVGQVGDPEAYGAVRATLDAKPGDFMMSRAIAQFYLGMSPATFKAALKRGKHPFAEPNGGAPKGRVMAWFRETVARKHAAEVPKSVVARVSRDLSTGRFYLVDESGVILADGQVSLISPADVEFAFKKGAGLRIYTLTEAMAAPWASISERAPWAAGRLRVIEAHAAEAQRALDAWSAARREAVAQDLEATLPAAKPATRRPPL